VNVERRSPVNWTRNVLNNNIKGIDKNCFVGNDQLLEEFASYLIHASKDKQVAVIDV
jgi:hypothetical protein